MITGPLGLRVNNYQKIMDRYVLTSPSMSGFHWEEAVVWAECKNCPKDGDGHVIIQEWCSCGIYSTVIPNILSAYFNHQNSIVMLVEALDSNLDGSNPEYTKGGHIWLYDEVKNNALYDPEWRAGITSPGAQIVYLVDYNPRGYYWGKHGKERHNLALTSLSQKLHTPILSLEVALDLCKLQWEKYDMKWDRKEDEYDNSNKT